MDTSAQRLRRTDSAAHAERAGVATSRLFHITFIERLDMQQDYAAKLFDQTAFNRLQDVIITAKGIKKDYPEAKWSECLEAAEKLFSRVPLF